MLQGLKRRTFAKVAYKILLALPLANLLACKRMPFSDIKNAEEPPTRTAQNDDAFYSLTIDDSVFWKLVEIYQNKRPQNAAEVLQTVAGMARDSQYELSGAEVPNSGVVFETKPSSPRYLVGLAKPTGHEYLGHHVYRWKKP